MGLDATARRRWFGALVLVAALAMLVAGETVLQGQLHGLGLLCYWLACLGLTSVAIVVAFLDARALGRQARQEQRTLFQNTLGQIAPDAKDQPATRPQRKN